MNMIKKIITLSLIASGILHAQYPFPMGLPSQEDITQGISMALYGLKGRGNGDVVPALTELVNLAFNDIELLPSQKQGRFINKEQLLIALPVITMIISVMRNIELYFGKLQESMTSLDMMQNHPKIAHLFNSAIIPNKMLFIGLIEAILPLLKEVQTSLDEVAQNPLRINDKAFQKIIVDKLIQTIKNQNIKQRIIDTINAHAENIRSIATYIENNVEQPALYQELLRPTMNTPMQQPYFSDEAHSLLSPRNALDDSVKPHPTSKDLEVIELLNPDSAIFGIGDFEPEPQVPQSALLYTKPSATSQILK